MRIYETPSSFLASLGGRGRRVLALGEPTHGIEEFLLLRNKFFQELVEHAGFTAIALESDCLAGTIVDDYVSGGQDSLDGVMEKGFSHEFGRLRGNRELVVWLRDCGKPLRFFGFDAPAEMMYAPSPRPSLLALHAFLVDPPHSLDTIEALLGEEERWVNPQAAMDPAESVGASPDAQRLRRIADDLQRLLPPEHDDPEALWRARLHARTATGLLRYHAAMASDSPDRISGLARVRGEMMAENLLAIAENHRTLAFAHNLHLQRHGPSADILGDGYAFIASALGSSPRYGIPGPGTVEAILSTLAAPGVIVRSADLAGTLTTTPPKRTSDYRYFPLDPDRLGDSDGIVYVNAAAS